MASLLNTLHVDLRPDWRGGQYQAWLLLRGLRACGHGAKLLTLRGSPLAARARRSGIAVHEVTAPFIRLRAARALRRLVHSGNYQVVHAHEAHAHTALWLARVPPTMAHIVSRRVVFSPGANWFSRQKYRPDREHYVAVSEYVRGSLRPSLRDNATVVYDGVELPSVPSAEEQQRARKYFSLPKEATVLACLGALEPGKGHLAAVEALPIIRQTLPAELLLGGEGPLRGRLNDRVRRLGLEKQVRLLGTVDNLETFFAATDIFLFPATGEGLGTALLLAMGHQLPVVALDGTAAAEVIRNGESGRLVLSAEPETIAGAVVYLARHPELARELAANARTTVAQRFTADRMVEETLAVYRRILQAHGSTA